jgi:hypothetical protein
MTPEFRRKLEANIFRGAHSALQPWDNFPWHRDRTGQCDSWKPHSSQALAIDVFGTIAALGDEERNSIIGSIASSLSLPSDGPWRIDLEWCDPTNTLKESGQQKTQIDVLATGPKALIFFECKFTEGGGTCGQTKRLRSGAHAGKQQCNGNYLLQTNPANGVASRCALTGKGSRYWEIIPTIFEFSAGVDHSPCPFAGSSYQWMRNLVLARAAAESTKKTSGVVIAYADVPRLHFPMHLASPEWLQFSRSILKGSVPLATISYQRLIHDASRSLSGASLVTWRALETWVNGKIARTCIKP